MVPATTIVYPTISCTFILFLLAYMIIIMDLDYLSLSSASRITASPPLKTAVVTQTPPAVSFANPRISIIPLAAGIENTSKAASNDRSDMSPRTCLA